MGIGSSKSRQIATLLASSHGNLDWLGRTEPYRQAAVTTMSFLFGKKKQAHNPLPPATRETHTSGGITSSGSTSSSIPTANGFKGKERGPGGAQSPPPGPPPGSLPGPTPGSSVNTSNTSRSEAHTPSPDHGLDQRGGLEKDVPVCSLRSTDSYQSKCAIVHDRKPSSRALCST